jgi:hypothetical protein
LQLGLPEEQETIGEAAHAVMATLFKEYIGKMATGVVAFLRALPPPTPKRPRAKRSEFVVVPASDSESEVSDEKSAAEVSAMEKRDKVTAVVLSFDTHDTPHTHTHTHIRRGRRLLCS